MFLLEELYLFFGTSEEKPPPELVKRWLRNYAAQGILQAAKRNDFCQTPG